MKKIVFLLMAMFGLMLTSCGDKEDVKPEEQINYDSYSYNIVTIEGDTIIAKINEKDNNFIRFIFDDDYIIKDDFRIIYTSLYELNKVFLYNKNYFSIFESNYSVDITTMSLDSVSEFSNYNVCHFAFNNPTYGNPNIGYLNLDLTEETINGFIKWFTNWYNKVEQEESEDSEE